MGSSAAKMKARGGAGELVPTIREFLTWHVIEKKMAARAKGEIARDEDEAEDERVPDSGVYTSGEHPLPANDELGEPVGELTYRVYTVADLEARGLKADLSIPSTSMSIAMMAAKTTPWTDVAKAVVNVFRHGKTWLSSPSPRPALTDVLRHPISALVFETRLALKQVAWKKVAFYGGISMATFLFLLFCVVTAADMTDDLKPSRVATQTSGDSYTSAIVAAQHPTVASPPPVAAPAATGDGLEVSSDEPAPAPVAKKPAKAKKQKKAPASGDMFIP